MSAGGAGGEGGKRSAGRLAFQVAAFAIGLGLLAWCVMLALKPENREQWRRLAEAPAGQVAALTALSAVAVLIDGAMFWLTLMPARRLRFVDVQAVNAVATFLGYLPFKVGMVFRVLVHTRRDRVHLTLIACWFAAFAAVVVLSLGPLVAATAWAGKVDGAWLSASAVLLGAGAVITLVTARALAGDAGLARLRRALGGTPGVGALLRSAFWGRMHAGFSLLASPAVVFGGMGLRLVDVSALAARFAIAASILGVALPVSDAVLVASVYYLLGALSPAGNLGSREGGTTFLTGILAIATKEEFAAVTLLVTATGALVNAVAAGVGILWLRPDRMVRSGSRP